MSLRRIKLFKDHVVRDMVEISESYGSNFLDLSTHLMSFSGNKLPCSIQKLTLHNQAELCLPFFY